MNLYNLKAFVPNQYQMAKFNDDFEVEAVYNLAPKGFDYTCDCPANQRSVITKPCKHRRMLPLMLGALNTDRFYDPDSRTWHQPLGDIDRPQAEPEVVCEAAPLPESIEPPIVGEAPGQASSTPVVRAAAPSSVAAPVLRRR